MNVAGFLASGFWRHFLCSWRRLAFAALGTGWSGALPARPRSCAPPTFWASAPSLGLFHVKGTVRKTISFPQQSLWEVPTLRGLWPSRCPKFSTDSHVNLTCPLHTEGPGERRSWEPLMGAGPLIPGARLDFALGCPGELSRFLMWQPSQCFSSPCRRARNSKQRSMPRRAWTGHF